MNAPFRPIRVLELRSVRGTGGGPEKTILLGAARADAQRVAVTVCYLRDLRDSIFNIGTWATSLGVDYVEVPERHSFDRQIWWTLRRIIRERQIDIVHAHDYKTNLLALLLAKVEGVMPLSTVHGWTGHTRRERFVYYPVDRWLLARFPRLIAVSNEIRRELIRAGAAPERISTVLNGVDPDMFRRDHACEPAARASLEIAPGSVVIGAVGRLEPQKRFDLLIEVFAKLRQARPELRLVIAGDGGSRQHLVDLIRQLALGDSCRLVGHVADVSLLHHAFDLFVQSSDYEGTPNAVLEAMALETPVVATDVGGTNELITQGVHGLLVPPGDSRALGAAIEEALTARAQTARRAAAARLRVEEELSFQARTQTVQRICDALVAA